jgi:hypothetical protein
MNNSSLFRGDLFKAWLVFLLTSFFGGMIAGGIAGFCIALAIGFAFGVSGKEAPPIETMKDIGRIAGYIAAMPVSYICYAWTVQKFMAKKATVEAPRQD